jgi:5-methylcytosine-specific restriction endonuclease McrA
MKEISEGNLEIKKDNEVKKVKYKKKNIPLAIRQQVWLKYNGKEFCSKCNIIWCKNIISVFSFHVGHVIPESKGGLINIENLRPICSSCNLSMSNKYTIDEWNILGYKSNCIFIKVYIYILRLFGY